MPAQVIVQAGPNTSPYDIASFPSFNNTPALAPLINTEIVKKSFPSMINYLLPKGDASLFALTAKMKEETALQIEHGFFSKIMVWPNFTLSDGTVSGSGVTSWPVLDGSMAIPGGLYMYVGVANATGVNGLSAGTPSLTVTNEIVRVTSNVVAGATTLTVVRNVGGTSGAAYSQYGTFVHVGNAFADASTRPNSFLTQEIRVINYTQIFRNAWAISGTVAAIQNLLGDTNIAKSKIECSQYHAMDIEKALFFGQKSNNTAGAMPIRTMNGVISQITDTQGASLFLPGVSQSSNIRTAASTVSSVATPGALDIDDLETWVNSTVNMSYDPMSGMERVMFVGASAHIVINKLARLNTTYYIERGETSWGLRFDRIKLTRADFIIIEHPLFNTNYVWSGLAVIVDLPSLSLAYMVNRKTKAEEYNQSGIAIDSAIDAQGGSLLTELTLLCKNPSGCGVMTNIRTAVDTAGTKAH
jgi:hypothetical protein